MKMRNYLFFLAGFSTMAFAQAPVGNNAQQFAQITGSIAGTSQACGQDVSTLSSRAAEVINLLTTVPAEQQQAMMVYEKALASSAMMQEKNHTMKCPDVLMAYASLPILKPDYKTTVLPAMAKMGTANAG
ncbi:MAG TPA: hypothetical protein VGV92_06850 [Gammaproteobacteria bacterium]|nr:hypothetical protein [Gammaproteobacteria bacterium]